MNPAVATRTPPRPRGGLAKFTTTWASQIGITVAFLALWLAFIVRFCWRIDGLTSARRRPRRVRLNAGFTTRGGDLLNAPAFFAGTAGGWPRPPRRGRSCPNKKRAGWNAMKRGIEF